MHKASCVREREARGARCLSDCTKILQRTLMLNEHMLISYQQLRKTCSKPHYQLLLLSLWINHLEDN